MHYIKVKLVIGLVLLLSLAVLSPASIPASQTEDYINEPDLPASICDKLQVPQGNKVAFRVYAVGVQVYKWNGVSWGFVGPVAMLFADSGYNGKVGIHYGGPTWESNSDSKVIASRLEGCSPDPTAIPWLLLQTVSTEGSGIFSSVTYIQRVNTKGGLPPSVPGTAIDELAESPYTTEYYFYRAQD